MHEYTIKSFHLSNNCDYFDQLQYVYHEKDETERELDDKLWENVVFYYNTQNCKELIKALLKLPKYPFRDSYVSCFRKKPKLIDRNPKQVKRMYDKVMSVDIDELKKLCSQPKSSNKQQGPSFKNWVKTSDLGFPILKYNDFLSSNDDAILDGSDDTLKKFAREYLGYKKDKGLDFIARIKGKYVIAEVKFITADGGAQTHQFKDAMSTLNGNYNENVIPIAILDGSIYLIDENSDCYINKTLKNCNKPVFSVLLLKEFLHRL